MKKESIKTSKYFSAEDLTLKPDIDGVEMWGVALDKTMLTYFEVRAESNFEMHSHKSEQITMVLEGELYFRL